jgi:CoA:oxalate CoA-transferase
MIDLGSPMGQSQLHALARRQALITNLRPSAIHKPGLTYEALHGVNPALVCVALTGFGIAGSRREEVLMWSVDKANDGEAEP